MRDEVRKQSAIVLVKIFQFQFKGREHIIMHAKTTAYILVDVIIYISISYPFHSRFFCSIAAFSERVLARWMILPGGALTQKETIEKADFTNLTWKLEGVNVSFGGQGRK